MDSILADFQHTAYLGSGPRNSIWFLSAVPQVAQYLSAVQEHSQLYHQNGEKHIIFLDNLNKNLNLGNPTTNLLNPLFSEMGLFTMHNCFVLCSVVSDSCAYKGGAIGT